MSFGELDFGELNLYSGGLCLDLAPGRSLDSVALFAGAVNAQSGDIADKKAFIKHLQERGVDDFVAVSLASLFVHEVRHFHDLILTHVGQWLITESLNLAAGLVEVLFQLQQMPACILPIPQWRDLSPVLYKTLAKNTSGELRPQPSHSLLSCLDSLAELTEVTDYFFQPPEDSIKYAPATKLLFEGLATSCQLAELNMIDSGNRMTVHSFVHGLGTCNARTYIDYFDYIETASKQFGYESSFELWTVFNLLSLRALCPLIKSTNATGEHESLPPALIFTAGLSDIYKYKRIPKPEDAITWIDELADQLGWLSLDKTFAVLQEMVPQRLAAMQASFNPLFSLEEATIGGYADCLKAHLYMLTEVRKDPMKYCNPFSYISNPMRWVACPLHLPIVKDNLPQVEGFLSDLKDADPVARESLISKGLKPGFLTIGASFGVPLVSTWDYKTMFDGIRLGHAIWRGFRPRQIAGSVTRAELLMALRNTQVYFL